jgi:hypothetical protein
MTHHIIHTTTNIAGKAFIIKLGKKHIGKTDSNSTKCLYTTHWSALTQDNFKIMDIYTYTHELGEGDNFTVCSSLHCPFSTQETNIPSYSSPMKPKYNLKFHLQINQNLTESDTVYSKIKKSPFKYNSTIKVLSKQKFPEQTLF